MMICKFEIPELSFSPEIDHLFDKSGFEEAYEEVSAIIENRGECKIVNIDKDYNNIVGEAHCHDDWGAEFLKKNVAMHNGKAECRFVEDVLHEDY